MQQRYGQIYRAEYQLRINTFQRRDRPNWLFTFAFVNLFLVLTNSQPKVRRTKTSHLKKQKQSPPLTAKTEQINSNL